MLETPTASPEARAAQAAAKAEQASTAMVVPGTGGPPSAGAPKIIVENLGEHGFRISRPGSPDFIMVEKTGWYRMSPAGTGMRVVASGPLSSAPEEVATAGLLCGDAPRLPPASSLVATPAPATPALEAGQQPMGLLPQPSGFPFVQLRPRAPGSLAYAAAQRFVARLRAAGVPTPARGRAIAIFALQQDPNNPYAPHLNQ